MSDWFIASGATLLQTAVSAFIIFAAMLLLVRLAGLRTFAKMSSIDFATTIAIGSILASVVISKSTSVLQGVVALASIVIFQQLFAKLKFASNAFEDLAENNPTLLMDGTEFLIDNMRKTGVSRSDVIAKLREANVIQLSEVRAVVLETTGDISVLHDSNDTRLQDVLLEGVER
ncbi:hypothetical protein LEM8419_01871 [Neolewinella maritima]|uniref:YetF C-terminal domain-containing protein n=1 Tax=Neolewinella maritima TaxID=1383882 RepID=A0ABM9B0W6_9BACT|nr:YetF domain-containing protein [Neolewinella maritima]CAH1000760.1 hypothetical protein LEM8419_01871 [Neolewinella maritima]